MRKHVTFSSQNMRKRSVGDTSRHTLRARWRAPWNARCLRGTQYLSQITHAFLHLGGRVKGYQLHALVPLIPRESHVASHLCRTDRSNNNAHYSREMRFSYWHLTPLLVENCTVSCIVHAALSSFKVVTPAEAKRFFFWAKQTGRTPSISKLQCGRYSHSVRGR